MSASSIDSFESTLNSLSTPESLSRFCAFNETVVLFDWDDTLFATKYLEIHDLNYTDIFSFSKSVEDFCGFLMNELKELENKILELFEEIFDSDAKIFIVSNADEKWIQNCLIHFLPELKIFIEKNEIKIYSAKNLFSKKFSAEKWKPKCFKKVLMENFTEKNSKMNVICVGDSNDEKIAALELSSFKHYEKINVKFVEMIKSPSIITICSQLECITENFDEISKSENFLHKLNFEKSKNKIILTLQPQKNDIPSKHLKRKRKVEKSILELEEENYNGSS